MAVTSVGASGAQRGFREDPIGYRQACYSTSCHLSTVKRVAPFRSRSADLRHNQRGTSDGYDASAYVAMDVTARFAIVPLCFVSLVTGVIESLGTTWVCFATIGCGEAGHHRRFDRLRGLTAYGRRKERELKPKASDGARRPMRLCLDRCTRPGAS
jgi:hypothetical protein